MPELQFNINPLVLGGEIEQPSNDEVKATPALWNASLEDAMKYGGDLTRAAIGAMHLRGDRRYIVVDTKVHMLMPGFMPAIPGWHTDGVPRGMDGDPGSKGEPNIWAQTFPDNPGPHYHLLVTGAGCLTEFVSRPIVLDIDEGPNRDLYKNMSHLVGAMVAADPSLSKEIKTCQVTEFGWWDIHTAIKAKAHEWRFLIRVAETDFIAPNTDLRQVIRTQQQVYVPMEFGW